MVAIAFPNGTSENHGAGDGLRWDDLYAKYVRYLAEELDTLLRAMPDPEMQEIHREELTPESRSAFQARVAEMGPKERAAYIEMLNEGFNVALEREIASLRLPQEVEADIERGVVPPDLVEQQARGLLTPSLDAWVKAHSKKAAD